MQVASSFLIELGNGDKFIWDMGTGSYVNLIATGVPAAKLTKVGARGTYTSPRHHIPSMPTCVAVAPPHAWLLEGPQAPVVLYLTME